jgi:hypothetical protein
MYSASDLWCASDMPLLTYHPVYNNDGGVKGKLRHRRLGFFPCAISLYWKSTTLHKDQDSRSS